MEYVILSLLVLSIILLLVIIFKKSKVEYGGNVDNLVQSLNEKNKQDLSNLYSLIKQLHDSQLEMIKLYNDSVLSNISNINKNTEQNLRVMAEKLDGLSSKVESQMEKLIIQTRENLSQLNENNAKKLDEMRIIVDDKLTSTLNDRLSKSFQVVSEQLSLVTKGLGEMQSLASGVGDLKKVLTNVKTRGTFGEVQLGALLEQMLAPSQFKAQVMLSPNALERVDFAINMPGKDEQNVLLPIDAKFPIEDFVRLVEATENGSQENIISSQKQLIKRVKDEAKSISEKYIKVPITTDFAIMYLPTESLYAEVIKQDGLFEQIQREYKVTICGPTTISALLNSLQMGFKTLAIQKRSGEIWSMLGTFKKEFSTYVELLTKTQKKLSEATDSIESATKKSEKIQKQLSKVTNLDDTGLLD